MVISVEVPVRTCDISLLYIFIYCKSIRCYTCEYEYDVVVGKHFGFFFFSCYIICYAQMLNQHWIQRCCRLGGVSMLMQHFSEFQLGRYFIFGLMIKILQSININVAFCSSPICTSTYYSIKDRTFVEKNEEEKISHSRKL